MGDADGVGAGEGHHVVGGEVLGGEVGDELGGFEEWRREVFRDFANVGDASVPSASGNSVGDVAGKCGSVPGCEMDFG